MVTLKDILDTWDVDKEVDQTELGVESARIPKLHGKYLRWLMMEKDNCNKLEAYLKRLYAQKVEYYVEGPANMQEWEAKKEIWKTVPERGRTYIRAAVNQYLDMDDDLETLRAELDESKVRIAALELIMKHVMSRSYVVNSMLEWQKWTGGN